MKNKGFTLVELLAVIVVLAVISIITIPMIGNVIEESKKKSLEQSASGLIEAASYYKISHEGVTEFVFDENKKGETIKGDKLEYKGNIEGTGKLYIDKNGDISLCLVDDKYYVYKNYNSGIYVGEVKYNNCIIGYDVLTNKYVAMLDDGTGQVSNVYSKDEVNDIVDSLQSQITTIDNNLESLSNNVGSHTEAISNLSSNLEELSESSITKIIITNATFSSGVLTVTNLIPEGKKAFAFIITNGLQAHTAHVWKNLANGEVHVTFRAWAENDTVMSGNISGILLCI